MSPSLRADPNARTTRFVSIADLPEILQSPGGKRGKETPSIIILADTLWQRQQTGCCSLSCSKTSLVELQDTDGELKSCEGLGGGKVGTPSIPSPGSHLTQKAMAASSHATEHLCLPKGHLPNTMDKVHKRSGFSSILSGTKPSTGLQLVEPHHQIPF